MNPANAGESLVDSEIEAHGGKARRLIARDGAGLRMACWTGAGATRDIVLLGGRSEFIEKFFETIDELVARGFRVWTMDWRGHGLSDRPLDDRLKCHIESYEVYLDDLGTLLGAVIEGAGRLKPLVLANSMGGHLALRYMHDHPGTFARAVLTAPMIDVLTPSYLPALARAYATAACWVGLGTHYIPSGDRWDRATMPFADNLLTNDPRRFSDEQRWLTRRPELALSGPTYGWMHATFASIDLCARPGYAAAIATPTLIVSAGDERIVRNDALMRLAAAMPACRCTEIAGARHEILKETDRVRAQFWAAFDDFVGASPAVPGAAPGLSSVAARA